MNLPTYNLNATSVAARNAEYADTPLTDIEGSNTYADPVLGCNKGASNAPGIGINTGSVNAKLEDWTVEDQAEAARVPQDSQHIGGDGLGDGDATNNPINVIQDTDINDTVGFVVATSDAVADADAGSDVLNKTGATIATGDRIWGPIAVV